MKHWTEDRKKRVQNWLGRECNCVFVGLNNAPISSLTSTTRICDSENNRYDLILGFDSFRNIYAAWNPYLHNHNKKRYTVSLLYKMKDEFTGYLSLYGSIKNRKHQYEKKLLIDPDFLETFCINWREYMKPDIQEEGYEKNKVLWADKYHPEPVLWDKYYKTREEIVIRDRDIVTRSRRDHLFRKLIISKYEKCGTPSCIICRCKIKELLEAAHIKPVSEGGEDTEDNGILLCRNHHKMFDEGMIKIHGDKLEVCDERVKEMPWYKDFVIEHKEKVVVPK